MKKLILIKEDIRLKSEFKISKITVDMIVIFVPRGILDIT